MDEENDLKRLFFGASIEAPWHQELPKARLIDENCRHITLAFLGSMTLEDVKGALSDFPKPHFKVGIFGKCDKLLFLPTRTPRVVAWHVKWFEKEKLWKDFKTSIDLWLQNHKFPMDKREHLDHITIGRSPFLTSEWELDFTQQPLFVNGIHLFESVGNLSYKPLWSLSFISPFEEIEHTADIAFNIKGESMQEVHLHAKLSLAFKFPMLLRFFDDIHQNSLEDIVKDLNRLIAKADSAVGCPFKAVSYHGEIKEDENKILNWEMIVDV